MHFGRTKQIPDIELALPALTDRTAKLMTLPWEGKRRLYVGCPIFSEEQWLGSFYPEGMKKNQFLHHYAQSFDTVEVNSTFYSLPNLGMIRGWYQKVPVHFRFCPKVFKGISHEFASGEWRQHVEAFWQGMLAFQDKLGLVFMQLPEWVGPNMWGPIKEFLKTKPPSCSLAVEFRQKDWFQDHRLFDHVVDDLYRLGCFTVITDTLGRRETLHMSLTGAKVCVRFLGCLESPVDKRRLDEWGALLKIWRESLDEVYFFVHHEDHLKIPPMTAYVQKVIQH